MGGTFSNRNLLNDIWGYADGNGNEYALVGTRGGFSVVDVTDGANPVQKFFISGATSTWRDIKTYSHYAYVVHDGFSAGPSDGILIVDMDSVNNPSPTFTRFFPMQTVDTVLGEQTYNRAHNIYIDENGILYVFGSNFGAGGVMMFDLTQDPEAPSFVGVWNEQYLHDGMARGDTLWGGAILAGKFYGIDVSNKSNPITLGSKTTPNSFSHNVWISDDNKTLFNTDEISGAFVASYDVSDMNNIEELDRIQTSYGGSDVIPHNTHVYGDFLVTSYYTSGLQIVDATHPDILIEVGYYDTSPLIGNGYNGAWGAYPYLPSGKVLISDMEQGLFVLEAAYLKGCYLDITVVDSVTQLTIPGADIQVLNTPFSEQTDIFGNLRFGFEQPKIYPVVASKTGYKTDTVGILTSRGVMSTKRIALLPLNFSISENQLMPFELYPNPGKDAFKLNLDQRFAGDEVMVSIFNMAGKEVFSKTLEVAERQVNHQLKPGIYLVKLKTSDAAFAPQRLVIQ
jgi:choice-of-anchor B domain-containing protein